MYLIHPATSNAIFNIHTVKKTFVLFTTESATRKDELLSE